MTDKQPAAALLEMLHAADVQEDGCAVFNHTPEEFGLLIMENSADFIAALTRPASPAPGDVEAVASEATMKVWRAAYEAHLFKSMGDGFAEGDKAAALVIERAMTERDRALRELLVEAFVYCDGQDEDAVGFRKRLSAILASTGDAA